MPYATNADLNDQVKKTYKSEHQRTAFRKAFNAALAEYKDESTAFAVAHKAAKEAKESDTMEYSHEYIQERDFSDKKRESLAKSGKALPDGSFPIENEKDLKNAIQAIGRAKDPAKAKAHIKARAKALGCTDCIPDTWESWQSLDGTLLCEAIFADGDSHDGLRQKLSQAIDGAVLAGKDMDGDDDGDQDATERKNAGYPSHYVRAVHDNHVIYSMNGKTFAHKYEKDGDGDPHLKGTPKEVEPAYKSVAKTDESFSESCPFAEANKKPELLCESYGDSGEITFTMIKPGWSKNNRYYSEAMLKRDHKIFEGAKMFVNHQTDKEAQARPEGDIRDWAANITKVWPEADGTIKAKAVVINPVIKETLKNLASVNQLGTMGVSIRAMGEAKEGEVEGKKGKIVESLLAAKSVDFVTFPGAGGQVESLQ